ncbi:hypothetical protein V6R21_12705 [Limibacter armeniacum]|uniref:alpha-amylase family glycosyl hydrolase n=1 Tax=Limibacter armeniacum TaxID=466084 RepID=UPI002FE67BB6
MTSHQSILKKILDYLTKHETEEKRTYYVPGLWLSQDNPSGPVGVNPISWFKEAIEGILASAQSGIDYNKPLSKIQNKVHGRGGDWTYTGHFYNIFPRQTAAYDHDNDGLIGTHSDDLTMSQNGFRETGTFLKCIALLPYIKSLGINTVYCLPLTSIGEDGNRGDLGSPYAIRNQYKLDELLADTLIPFSVDEQFQAFVEAAHMMGMRVVMEFVLRTNSLGGDWVMEHPEWFYWIDATRSHEYHSPEFPEDELIEIKKIPKGNGTYFPPSTTYRSLFKKPPTPEQIKIENGKYVAYTKEGKLIIPGAFADWPPDDIQPAWTDVTYLRMYNYPFAKDENDFNYIAYNTIRYYDPQLAKPANVNRPLWDRLAGVIPHYQTSFGIDGVMMDMGHAVPQPLMEEIIGKARAIDPDFAFCEENFDITLASREAGYNAVLGHEWRVTSKPDGIQRVIEDAAQWLAVPFYGTPETHNTPRATQRGGIAHTKCTYVINSFLPNCIPLIHQGFELAEDWPVNTGLNFTKEENDYFRDKQLPLFFKSALNWDTDNHIIPFIQQVSELREQYNSNLLPEGENFIANGNEHSIKIHRPHGGFGHVIAFERFDPWQQHVSLLIVANTNFSHSEEFYLHIEGTYNNSYYDHLSSIHYTFHDSWVSARLEPGQCMVMKINKHW